MEVELELKTLDKLKKDWDMKVEEVEILKNELKMNRTYPRQKVSWLGGWSIRDTFRFHSVGVSGLSESVR